MLYDIKELNENDYKKECAKLLIAFENPNYKQENTIHIMGNVTVGYGLDLKTGNNLKLLLKGYLPDDSKKLKIGNEKLTFYGIIEKYRANKTGFTDPKVVKGYLQNKIFNFSLTQEQAQEVLERTFDSYKQYVSNHISDNLLKYSQEKVSLVSLHYHGRFYGIRDSIRHSIVAKNSRFLSWFLIRYKTNPRNFIPFQIRACDEADIYLSNPNINQLKLIFDIFSHLNIKKEIIEYRIHKIKTNRTNSKQDYKQDYKQDTLYNLAQWYENDLDFMPYQNYITDLKKFQKLKLVSQLTKKLINDITTTLKPYLDYLNTLIQKTFSLENIYCIQSFYGNLGAKKLTNIASINKILSQRFSNNSKQPQPTTQDSTAQANLAQSTAENPTQILILYPTPTPLPIQIIQPPNTFLTLVLGKSAKLDCSKLIVGQCAILYLEYDEKEKESTQNPKLTALKSNAILTLNTQDSITYEASHNNILYTISKNDGVLKVSLKDKREQAIELYNFAKENEYRILRDSPSQMLDIQLKLQDNKELDTSHNGNFSLTINNLTLLDSKGKNLDITTKQDFTLYLHNCENRQVYTSTTIIKNSNSDTYSITFHFDLILEETSNLFKRTTKLIVATQNLANDFSTSKIHSKGNVAIIPLSSADKQGGSYTFSKRVSAQEFESQAIHTAHQYLASNDDSLAYEVAFGEKADTIQIFNKGGIYLFSIERKDGTETKLSTEELYGISGIQWFESSADNYHKLIDVNPDLQDKEKCEGIKDYKGLGILYFTWRDIVEFALIDRYSFQYNPYGNGNWKAVENGAKGYRLVSMEGIPYWADAVGQLPFAIDIYRKRLSETKNKDLSRKFVIQKGYEYGNGLLFIDYDNSNSYDNAMILRGVNWAEKNFDIDGSGVRNNNINTSLLRFDSQGKIVYEW